MILTKHGLGAEKNSSFTDKHTMARRSAPPGSGPAYMSPSFPNAPRGRLHDTKQQLDNESAFGRFYREQIAAPQYLAGNISILTSAAMFAAGVFALRQWGDVLTVGL